MKKKEKKSENIEKQVQSSQIDNRFELTSKIDELKSLAQNCYLSGKYQEAIKFSEKIIKLAIQGDVSFHIKEQEKFINIIADKLQKEYIFSEIKNVAIGIQELYETLIRTGKIERAHEILVDFKKKYEDFPDFESITIVQKLIINDNKEWIKYRSSKIDEIEKHPTEQPEEDEFDSTLDEIQRFLKTR